MKKSTILKIALLALPLAVVAIAISPNSVTVIHGMDAPVYTSFANVVTDSAVGWCAPVALLLTYGVFGLAVFHLVTGKTILVKIIRGAAFVGTCLIGCPILVPGEVKVIPSVFAAILMLALWILSHYMVVDQKKEKEASGSGRRLSTR